MATTTLICKQCNFENEPERVYCHNCGAKLDRSLLPPEATKRADPVIVQERVRRMVRPRRGGGRGRLRSLFFSVAIGALLAVLVVVIRAPADVPAPIEKDKALEAPSITDDMEGLISQGAPASLHYFEDGVNAFLQPIHGDSQKSSSIVPAKFERAYVHFDEGFVRVTYVQSIFGWPIYASVDEAVSLENGQVVGKPLAAKFGRLAIPAKALPYAVGVFTPLWKVLERDKNAVAKLGAITFHKAQGEAKARVDMLNKAAAATAAAH